MKLHKDRELFSNAIHATAQEFGMAPEFVEKDYWICQILQRLSRHPLSERIVWKGGTSLSKAYGLIKRFSSDVDFAVLLTGLSQNQQKKLVAKIGRDTTADLEELYMPEETIKNNRFRKTYHAYTSVLGRKNENLNFLGNHVIVEINTYGNPYPYVIQNIKPFITEIMQQRGLDSLIEELDMQPFELNVLDKRRTLCEKAVSLIRFSFEDDAIAGVASKIRHFYDLYYLLQDNECIEYLNTIFPEDVIQLIIHDKAEFDRPPKWKNSDVLTSPLFRDFELLWTKIAVIYNSEMGALSYGAIPSSDEIQKSVSRLFEIIKACIEVV